MKTNNSRKWLVIVISLSAVLLGGAAYKGVATYGGAVQPPIVVPLAPVGQFDEIHTKAKSRDWEAQIKTKGVSDLHVVEVTIQPGGALGWHFHQGPSFVIVKSGTATFYEGNDPTCTPHVIPTGSTLFEPADDVHIVRNEGSVPLVNVVVQLIPTGAPRLIPQPSPGNCPF